MKNYNFIIIGAGIMGLTVARELALRSKGNILILEKESGIAHHASGRNSGVLHSGIYYNKESLKARFCLDGNHELRNYCKKHGLKLLECGKVIVTKNKSEIAALEELYKRGTDNGVELRMVDSAELKKIEPHSKTYETAIHCPETAVVDPKEVCAALFEEVKKLNVDILLNTEVKGLKNDNQLETDEGIINFSHLINCAGAHADKIARMFGIGSEYRVLPFKGIYYNLRSDRINLVNSNIYPVPDLRNPFLGIHLTKTVNGEVIIGPTATPVFGRENYHGMTGIDAGEMARILSIEARLFIFNKANFRSVAIPEMKKYIKSVFVKEVQELVPIVKSEDIIAGKISGIRAQLINVVSDKLEMDFIVQRSENSTHILNAVSPAFTCSMPLAGFVVDGIN